MKLALNITERLTILSLLPEQGNFLTLKIVRELREDLSFKEEELERFELRQVEGRVLWNLLKDEEVDIEIGTKALEMLVSALREKDEKSELNAAEADLFEKLGLDS